MAVSKKRKRKNGKTVGNGQNKRLKASESRVEQFAARESGVSLQDLINVLAYQEYVKDGTIVADDAKLRIDGDIPVTVGEGEHKRQVGTAVQVEGRDELSVRITDHDIIEKLDDPGSQYSISTEDEEA